MLQRTVKCAATALALFLLFHIHTVQAIPILRRRDWASSVLDDAQVSQVVALAGGPIANLAQRGVIDLLQLSDPTKDFTYYQNALSNPVGLVTGQFLPAAIAVASGFILAIFNIIFGLLFWCCRCCCNNCGGRKPKRTGYSKSQIVLVSIFIVIDVVLVLVTGVYLIVGSSALDVSVSTLFTDADNLASGVSDFADQAVNGLTGIPTILSQYLNALPAAILALNIGQTVDTTMSPNLTAIFNDMLTINSNIQDLNGTIISTKADVNTMNTNLGNISTLLQTLNTQLTSLSTVSVGGNSYPLTVPTVPSVTLPNVTTLVDFSTIDSGLSAVPDLIDMVNSLNGTYQGVLNGINDQVNSTLQPIVQSVTSGGLIGTLNSTLNSLATSSISPIKTQVSNIRQQIHSFAGTAAQIDGYRNMGTQAIVGLIYIPFLFAFLGVLCQSRSIVAILKPLCIILAFFVWIQFSIYYIIALPVNGLVAFKPTYYDNDYMFGTVPALSLTSSNSTGANKTHDIIVSIKTTFASCQQGRSLFNATVNSRSETLPDQFGIGTLFEGNGTQTRAQVFLDTMGITAMFNNVNLSSAISFSAPSLTGVNSLSSLNLNSLSQLNISVNVPLNISSVNSDLQTLSDGLTPATFVPSYTPAGVTTALNDFNTQAVSSNNAFTPWTKQYIITHFVTGSSTFDATTITNLPAGNAATQAVNAKFQIAFNQIQFEYQANQAIANVRTQISAIQSTLSQLNSTLLTVTQQASNMTATLNSIPGRVNGTATIVTDLVTKVNNLPQVLANVATNVQQVVVNGVIAHLSVMYEAVISLLFDSTVCGNLVAPLSDIITVLTVNWSYAFNLMWSCFMLMGIWLFAGFILGVKGSKRLGVLRRVAPSDGEERKSKKYSSSHRVRESRSVKD